MDVIVEFEIRKVLFPYLTLHFLTNFYLNIMREELENRKDRGISIKTLTFFSSRCFFFLSNKFIHFAGFSSDLEDR